MEKEEIIKKLESLMATVQMAHYKGRELGVRAHESGEFCISIDLYNFEGDGKPVCDGLTFSQEGKSDKRRAFSICYDPSDENTPLWILCCDDSGGIDDDTDMLPKYLPEELLTAIATWLEKNIAPGEVKSEKGKVKNDVIYIRVLEQDTCDQIRIGAAYPVFTDKLDKEVKNVIQAYDKRMAWCGGWTDKNNNEYHQRIAIVDAETLQSVREIWKRKTKKKH